MGSEHNQKLCKLIRAVTEKISQRKFAFLLYRLPGNHVHNFDLSSKLQRCGRRRWDKHDYDFIEKVKVKFLKSTHHFINRFHTPVIFWPSTRPKNAIPRWCTGRKWHIPMASNRKKSRGWIKADNMGQGEGPTVPLQCDAPEESDPWTAWQLFLLDDD